MSFINFARVMLAALEQGRDATSQKIFLPQELALSKGNFETFDQVMNAWDEQIRYYTRKQSRLNAWWIPYLKKTPMTLSALR